MVCPVSFCQPTKKEGGGKWKEIAREEKKRGEKGDNNRSTRVDQRTRKGERGGRGCFLTGRKKKGEGGGIDRFELFMLLNRKKGPGGKPF